MCLFAEKFIHYDVALIRYTFCALNATCRPQAQQLLKVPFTFNLAMLLCLSFPHDDLLCHWRRSFRVVQITVSTRDEADHTWTLSRVRFFLYDPFRITSMIYRTILSER